MLNPEKLYEMMNPSKAIEALNLGKIYDAKAQAKILEKSVDQVFGLVGIYQAQTRKAVALYLEQSEAAVKESQKLLNEWIAAATRTSSVFASEVEANVKEVAKVLELPKAAKASKAA